MSYTLFHQDDLPHDGNTYEFQGIQRQDTDVSFIWVDMPPGGTIRLHKHPHEEIFIIQEGIATFTVGSAKAPHMFMNLRDGRFKQIDIHVSKQFLTDWLED